MKDKRKKKYKKLPAVNTASNAVAIRDPLQAYLSEISRYDLLTREEEIDLGKRIREQNDPDAAFIMATSNLRLVVKIALEFQKVWMQNLLDLIQEGNIGLMQAVQKFDPYKGVKFSYYASFWIKAYILKFIMDNWRLVKIGTTQGQRKLFFKLKKEKQKLIEEGFDPQPKLLSNRLGVTQQEIIQMEQRLNNWDLSLNSPVRDDSETERIAFVSDNLATAEESLASEQMKHLLREKVEDFKEILNAREKDIFENRLFSDEPLTLQELGDKYDISRERVRQVEKAIVKKIKDFFQKEIPDFESYAGYDDDK